MMTQFVTIVLEIILIGLSLINNDARILFELWQTNYTPKLTCISMTDGSISSKLSKHDNKSANNTFFSLRLSETYVIC